MQDIPNKAKQSSLTLQSDIRTVMANIRLKQQNTLHSSKKRLAGTNLKALTGPDASNTVSKNPVTIKASAPRTSSEREKSITLQQPSEERNQTRDAKKKQMLENTFARKLFFRHTDITQSLVRKLPERSETTRQKFAVQLYEDYVLEPKKRIRKYLDEVRFDTRYNEGLFRMAIKLPITSAQELTVHKQKLAQACIKKLCFVDMTVNNLVLEHQEKIIATLKERFNNWSGKLDKLSSYITMYQRQREADDRKFRSQLKRHSSMKGCWSLLIPGVVEELVRESRIPSEKRKSLYWSTLRFDDEALNEKYETGDYCRSQNDMDIEPEELIEFWPPSTIVQVQEENLVENRELQLVEEKDNTSAVQSNNVCIVAQRLPVERKGEPQLSSEPHQDHTYPTHSAMLIPNETWEGEIEISQQPSSVQRTKHSQNQPHQKVGNQLKSILPKKRRSLKGPLKVRARSISYEMDTPLNVMENKDATIQTSNAPNQSIAFVPVSQECLILQQTPLSQDSPLTNLGTFIPCVTSTQNQSQTFELIAPVPIAEVPSTTQDPLLLSENGNTTMAPSNAIIPCALGLSSNTNILLVPETISQDIQNQTTTQPSSTIPPFQALKPTPSGSTVISNDISLNSFHLKQEVLSQLQSQTDLSGYEDYVEMLPTPNNCITIDSDSDSSVEFDVSKEPIDERVCKILARKEDVTEMSPTRRSDIYLSCSDSD